MKAYEAFERRRQLIEEQLRAAKDMQEAVACARMALEQIGCELAQTEQDERLRQRQQAVFALAKRSPELLAAARAKGEIVIDGPASEEKAGKRQLGIKAAGAIVLAALALCEMIMGRPLFALAQTAGALLLMMGAAPREKKEIPMHARGISGCDAAELTLCLGEICQAADICTEDLALLEPAGMSMRVSGTADEATLDLLVSLMEAKASGRGETALRSLAQAEQYLHLLGMEIVYYAPENADFFDILPTMGDSRTIRPAIMKEGKLLRRGVAACRAERSGV